MHLGIDLGGTKTEIIALDVSGATLRRQRVPTPREDYVAILRTVVDLVDGIERTIGACASVGIGTPGSVSRATGLLRGSNSVCLNGRPVQRDLEAALGRKVLLTNDANCFALSEATDGAGAGHGVVFGVILGTGVGGGVVVRGHVLDGPNGIAGEWGHNPMPWPVGTERPGPLCFCGQTGCIETFLSGPAMQRDHALSAGMEWSPAEIDAHAAAGDAQCEATLQRYEERLARALAHVVNVLDPDVIVLGGGVSNIERLYDNVAKRWGAWVFSDRVDTRIVRHRHGDSSGVRGAAWLGAALTAGPAGYIPE